MSHAKFSFFTFILMLFELLAIAQPQNNFWYFGNKAVVDFSSGPPKSIVTSNMVANEGNATISDKNGNLLFYSNGQQIFDATGSVMPNGSGLTSDLVTCQGVLIVPHPGNDSKYYVFTTDTWEQSPDNLRYSIVDMNLNGGKGDVNLTKNILLNSNCSEQLTAVRHSNGTDFWIVIHEKNNHYFKSYKLSATGINTVPVVSDLGMDYVGGNRFGSMKFSHNCNKLVSVLGSTDPVNETIQIYDFNPGTGVISNANTIATYNSISRPCYAEFSPDDTKLYIATLNETALYQFNLVSSNISSTKINVALGSPGIKSGLSLGNNGKIYVGIYNGNSLSAINSPNLSGSSCNYQSNSIALFSGSNCVLFLPNTYNFNCVATVLPIELKYFDATTVENNVYLEWCTASEINNAYFLIERSNDNIHWTPINNTPGSGTTSIESCYRVIDNDPTMGVSYYRLTQFDYDGNASTYYPRSIKLNSKDVQIFSNAAERSLIVRLKKQQNIQLKIISILGQTISVQENISGNEIQLDVSKLSTGIYTLILESQNTFIDSFRFYVN